MSPLFVWRRAVDKLHGPTSTDKPIIRRPYNAAELRSLTVIWKRAVVASHDFLSPADIAAMEPQVRDTYLQAVVVRVAVDENDTPLGFIGMKDSHVEMLFVDPTAQRDGVGSALIEDATDRHGELTVDVNEQNAMAHGWYLNRGFVETGRSETDAEGRPFPLLHLRKP